MTTYYKAVRPDGTDFYSGTVQWVPPEGHAEPWIVRHASRDRLVHGGHASAFLSAATVPTDCTGMSWPCRLLKVRSVNGYPVAYPDLRRLPNRGVAMAWEVIEELDPCLTLGPQADQIIALIDKAGRLRRDESRRLAAAGASAWAAVRDAAWAAVRDAAWAAARDTAWAAGRAAVRDAAWAAAWGAVWAAGAADSAAAAASAAAEALVVRDCISREHYDIRTRPWRVVIGAIHPDDPYLP